MDMNTTITAAKANRYLYLLVAPPPSSTLSSFFFLSLFIHPSQRRLRSTQRLRTVSHLNHWHSQTQLEFLAIKSFLAIVVSTVDMDLPRWMKTWPILQKSFRFALNLPLAFSEILTTPWGQVPLIPPVSNQTTASQHEQEIRAHRLVKRMGSSLRTKLANSRLHAENSPLTKTKP